MWPVGMVSITNLLTGLADLMVNDAFGIQLEFMSLVVAVMVDSLIYIFHNGLARPIIIELYGNFILTRDMFDAREIVGIILNYSYEKMRIIALAIMTLISIWQLFKTYFAHFIQTEVEDGVKIAIKLIFFTMLIWSSRDICMIFVGMGADAARGFINLATKSLRESGMSTSESIKKGIEIMFEVIENMNYSVFSTGGDGGGVFDLVKFIILLQMDKHLVRLGLELAEKCITLLFLVVISPIAFACGLVKSASNMVLSKWISLFASSVLYHIMQGILMAFMFRMVEFMTVRTMRGGTLLNATYMVKEGQSFKFVSMMWATILLAKNAPYIIDQLGFSFLGTGKTQLGAMTGSLSLASAAIGDVARAGKSSKPSASGGNESGVNYGEGNKKPGVNYGEGNKEAPVNYGEGSKDPGVNYGEGSKDPGVNYGEGSKDPGINYGEGSRDPGINYGNESGGGNTAGVNYGDEPDDIEW